MHLLNSQPGGFSDEQGIVSVNQTPADIIFLSAADTDIALLGDALHDLPTDYPTVRFCNLLHLKQHASVDLYFDQVLRKAKLLVVSLLGGINYWNYGVQRLNEAKAMGIKLIVVPGDEQPDPDLLQLCNVDGDTVNLLWRYLREGGVNNAKQFWRCLGHKVFYKQYGYDDPEIFPKVCLYHPEHFITDLATWKKYWHKNQAVIALLFYRSHLQAGNLFAFNELISIISDKGLNPLPIAVNSLKDKQSFSWVQDSLAAANVRVIINTTGFSSKRSENSDNDTLFTEGLPVIQAIFAGSNQSDWENSNKGLIAADIAMHVALPEMDGCIISRAVSFKSLLRHCQRSQTDIVRYQLLKDRAEFVTDLAFNWSRLQKLGNAEKRIAIIVANYPNKDGRIANGVGLDTPASLLKLLQCMQSQDYRTGNLPQTSQDLMRMLLSSVSNDDSQRSLRHCWQSMSLHDYQLHFDRLPKTSKQQIVQRWGEAAGDPMVRNNRIMIAGVRFGNVFVGIQPARGYHIDLKACYHDPDLVPPHAYLAFYFWIRHSYAVNAVVHMGKHGNMEWLPGKATALSQHCWPDIVFGPLPHIYPFIVNDPGEGAQAKRRSQAVIIDHLTPPLARAESYGELQQLEQLMDEYYEAVLVDSRRSEVLRKQLLRLAKQQHLHEELTIADDNDFLKGLDNYLCELKEAQIRHGLHIFGQPMAEHQLDEFLLALARFPSPELGLLYALRDDCGLDPSFDPLNCDFAEPWLHSCPEPLRAVSTDKWRTSGDTRERLELLAKNFIHGLFDNQWPGEAVFLKTTKVLRYIKDEILAKVVACPKNELRNCLNALSGRYVCPGPSGAPSRGRIDVLPTGRNFYSLDTRAIPTPTAWHLGWKSADLMLRRYLQENGEFPCQLGISVWGTATMRTGGDDIAQAMALLGVRPVWLTASNRVIDFEILPLGILARPRVDVTLRVSGFFRDAFFNVINLFDQAVQAVANLDEPAADNPLRARVLKEQSQLEQQGIKKAQAKRRASFRVFGSKPGAYGAGLQGLMDQLCWQTKDDLAKAYLNWGGFAYGQDHYGVPARDEFSRRLSELDVVMQNQDNREHDLLDSDDYYQFHGGMSVAVQSLTGKAPSIYFGDHANPENPRIRSLKEELSRVLRSRVLNPKWINAMRKHGYKGAFEMAATLDYLFAYDATTDVVADYQYANVSDALILDADNQKFLKENNPHALKEMAERMVEAMQRGMWQQPGDYRQELENILLDAEQLLESSS